MSTDEIPLLTSEEEKRRPRFGDPANTFEVGAKTYGPLLWFTTLTNLGMIIAVAYLLSQSNEYRITGDQIISGDPRIEVSVDDSTNPPTALLTLRENRAIFGGANYSCDPNRPIQPIAVIPLSGLGGLEESWTNVGLFHTIENTNPDMFSLDDNLYSVTINNTGTFEVHAHISVAAPLNITADPPDLCIFVDYEEIGLFDVLRRGAPTCQPAVFVGSAEYGPLLVSDSYDWIGVSEPPVRVQIRAALIADTPGQLGIVLSRLKILQN